MFLIDKKIAKYDEVLLQFTTARLITNYNNYDSLVITIYDKYYNLRRLLLQFTTGITIVFTKSLEFTTE